MEEIKYSNMRKNEEVPVADLELVLFLIRRISQPCKDKNGNDVRSVYLREAKKVLANNKFKNLYAKKILQDTLEAHKE